MGGGRPKVEAPKPGPYEKELAKRMRRFAPYEEIILRESAWAWPGASAVGTSATPAAPAAPVAPVATTAPSPDVWKRTFKVAEDLPEAGLVETRHTLREFKGSPAFEKYVALYKGLSTQELQKALAAARESAKISPAYGGSPHAVHEVAALEYLLALRSSPTAAPAPVAPAALSAPPTPTPSPTRPPTYLLAPYMEVIEREYSKAKEAISGMRPGGAKERAMLELEAYWKPQAKAAATRALYEEARATLASMVGAGYGPTLRTLVGLEQQRSALEYQQRAAAAQAAAAQQASMWQSLGGLASLGMMALFF